MVRNKIWLLLLLSIPGQILGQMDTIEDYLDTMDDYSQSDSNMVFTIIEEQPVFLKGGDNGLYKIIEENLTYPQAALYDRVGGKVVVEFTVDTSGNLIDINILQGLREDIDQEALRLVGLLTPWKPGMQNNKKVKVRYMIPLYFWPDDQFKKKYLKKNGK